MPFCRDVPVSSRAVVWIGRWVLENRWLRRGREGGRRKKVEQKISSKSGKANSCGCGLLGRRQEFDWFKLLAAIEGTDRCGQSSEFRNS